MTNRGVIGDVEQILGGRLNETAPDEDIAMDNELTFSEVAEMVSNFAREQAERDAAAGLRLAGIACTATAEQGWENVHIEPKPLPSTSARVGEYAKAEMTAYIGLDKVYRQGNGRMFNDVAQGQQLLAVGIESYILAYLDLVRQFAPQLVPHYVPR